MAVSLRCTELTSMLQRILDLYSTEFPEHAIRLCQSCSRHCHRCDLVKEAEALLVKPVSVSTYNEFEHLRDKQARQTAEKHKESLGARALQRKNNIVGLSNADLLPKTKLENLLKTT